MNKDKKTVNFFSKPLMKQNIKSNLALTLAIIAVMILMTAVTTYSESMMTVQTQTDELQTAQANFYQYLYVMASYNEATGSTLSYDDFNSATDTSMYDTAFAAMNAQSEDLDLSSDGFKEASSALEAINPDIDINTYVHEFEYVYAMNGLTGCFSDTELSIDDLMTTMYTSMGLDSDMIENLAQMDSTSMFTKTNYTIMGILPLLIFVIIVCNSLVVEQVDKGSMAYVLSTPTKRNAVVTTQVIFSILAPLLITAISFVTRIISAKIFIDDPCYKRYIALYVGMYLLTEAFAGICFLGSCLFNQSKKAMAFGGGITVWCFISSLLGLFGMKDLVNVGFGVKELDFFNKTTLMGLFDVEKIVTIGTGDVNYGFVWKFVILAVITITCYAAGSYKFKKKDLPL